MRRSKHVMNLEGACKSYPTGWLTGIWKTEIIGGHLVESHMTSWARVSGYCRYILSQRYSDEAIQTCDALPNALWVKQRRLNCLMAINDEYEVICFHELWFQSTGDTYSPKNGHLRSNPNMSRINHRPVSEIAKVELFCGYRWRVGNHRPLWVGFQRTGIFQLIIPSDTLSSSCGYCALWISFISWLWIQLYLGQFRTELFR